MIILERERNPDARRVERSKGPRRKFFPRRRQVIGILVTRGPQRRFFPRRRQVIGIMVTRLQDIRLFDRQTSPCSHVPTHGPILLYYFIPFYFILFY